MLKLSPWKKTLACTSSPTCHLLHPAILYLVASFTQLASPPSTWVPGSPPGPPTQLCFKPYRIKIFLKQPSNCLSKLYTKACKVYIIFSFNCHVRSHQKPIRHWKLSALHGSMGGGWEGWGVDGGSTPVLPRPHGFLPSQLPVHKMLATIFLFQILVQFSNQSDNVKCSLWIPVVCPCFNQLWCIIYLNFPSLDM